MKFDRGINEVCVCVCVCVCVGGGGGGGGELKEARKEG